MLVLTETGGALFNKGGNVSGGPWIAWFNSALKAGPLKPIALNWSAVKLMVLPGGPLPLPRPAIMNTTAYSSLIK